MSRGVSSKPCGSVTTMSFGFDRISREWPTWMSLALAVRESRVCLTFDKDFGQLAANRPVPHDSGVVLLRLPPPASVGLAQSIVIVLESRSDWVGHFSVVEPGRIRMRSLL
jgi:hypothetical protein